MSIGVSTSTKPLSMNVRRMAALARVRTWRLRCRRAPAQVDVAVAEPDGLVDLGALVERERDRLGRRQHLDRAVLELDLAGGELGVDRALERGCTVPVMRSTYSLRRSWALETTHWTMPVRSRRSMKARCSPCSRRLSTQPQTDTSWPTSVGAEVAAPVVRSPTAGPFGMGRGSSWWSAVWSVRWLPFRAGARGGRRGRRLGTVVLVAGTAAGRARWRCRRRPRRRR